MMSAELRFYAELNDFLPAGRRYRSFRCQFLLSGSVKDLRMIRASTA